MKKVLSIVMSLIMAVSVCAVAAIPAMAQDVVSPGSITTAVKITVEVNGSSTKEVTYSKDSEDPNIITFTYTGSGNLTGWEFPGMTEGEDYVVSSEEGNSITIQLINDYDGEVVANAIVDESEGTATGASGTTAESTTAGTTKEDNNSTSPKTGAVSASGIAVAGAGVAILAALKKKNSDEE